MTIVAFAGRKGAGKTTLADRMCDHHSFIAVTLSEPLKNMLDVLFAYLPDLDMGEPTRMLYGDLKQVPSDALYGQTPREVMQTLGTEWGRNLVHPDLWVDIAMHDADRLQRMGADVVITDIRFLNEVQAVRERGGLVFWIDAESNETDEHISENSISASDCDHVITNNFGDAITFCEEGSAFVLGHLK